MKRSREEVEKMGSKWVAYQLGYNDLLADLIAGKKVRLSQQQNA